MTVVSILILKCVIVDVMVQFMTKNLNDSDDYVLTFSAQLIYFSCNMQ